MERERLTADICLMRVVTDDALRPFEAGQYVSLGLPRDGGLLQRPYSPANAPGQGRSMLFLIRRVQDGQLTPLLWELPVGARVRVGPPKGLFRLLPDDRRRHLLVATGTGIAPLVSMVSSLLTRPDPPPIVIVHGVRHEEELAFRDRLERWSREFDEVTYVPTVSRPSADVGDRGVTPGRASAVLPEMWHRLALTPPDVVAYLCGNPSVVAAIGEQLEARGMDPSAIRREEYWPAVETTRANS